MPQEAVPKLSFEDEQTLRRLAYVASLGELTAPQYERIRPELAALPVANSVEQVA